MWLSALVAKHRTAAFGVAPGVPADRPRCGVAGLGNSPLDRPWRAYFERFLRSGLTDGDIGAHDAVKPMGCDTVTDAYLSVHHGSQKPHRSLSSHQPTADVKATSCPSKGVTCRRVLESHRYRWRRLPLSDFALRSGSRHQRRPSLAQVRPRQPNLLLLRPRLRPCPGRPAACRQGTGLPMRMSARRYPGWVR